MLDTPAWMHTPTNWHTDVTSCQTLQRWNKKREEAAIKTCDVTETLTLRGSIGYYCCFLLSNWILLWFNIFSTNPYSVYYLTYNYRRFLRFQPFLCDGLSPLRHTVLSGSACLDAVGTWIYRLKTMAPVFFILWEFRWGSTRLCSILSLFNMWENRLLFFCSVHLLASFSVRCICWLFVSILWIFLSMPHTHTAGDFCTCDNS